MQVYAAALSDNDRAAGPSQPVLILTAADLVQNGGRYELAGGPAVPVFIPTDGRKVAAGPAIPIYPLNTLS